MLVKIPIFNQKFHIFCKISIFDHNLANYLKLGRRLDRKFEFGLFDVSSVVFVLSTVIEWFWSTAYHALYSDDIPER